MDKNLKKILALKNYTISILPHDNADVDAILSSVLLSKLLNFLGISNEILIFDNIISKDTLYILSLLGINVNQFMVKKELKDRKLFLLDHYVTIHKGEIVGCFDHHPNSEVFEYSIYENKKTCATACIVYKYMLEAKMPVNKRIVEILAYAMLVDTTGFLSTKTIKEEALELPKLLEEYGLDFEKIREASLLYTDIDNMGIGEMAKNGLKTYNFKRGKVKASYIQLKCNLELDILDEIIGTIQEKMIEETIEVWVYIVYALENSKTYVHYVYPYHVISIPYNKILSRGNDIMPYIEKMYN